MDNVIKLKNYDATIKVELNDDGDYMLLTADSATFFDNYVGFLKKLVDLTESTEANIKAVQNEYKDDATLEEKMELASKIGGYNINFSNEATKLVDDFLGEGVTYKYFKTLYDNVKDFIPDPECFIDFMEQITPVVEQLYGKKIEVRKTIDRNKVSKYQPQDFKKKAKK